MIDATTPESPEKDFSHMMIYRKLTNQLRFDANIKLLKKTRFFE